MMVKVLHNLGDRVGPCQYTSVTRQAPCKLAYDMIGAEHTAELPCFSIQVWP